MLVWKDRKRLIFVGVCCLTCVGMLFGALYAWQEGMSERIKQTYNERDPSTGNGPAIEYQSPSYDGLLELELIAYMHAITDFKGISVDEANTAIANDESIIIYVGRATCEWCRRFAPALQSCARKNGIMLYYLDSSDTETDIKLQEFRKQYRIETVPSLLRIDRGTIDLLEVDASATDLEQAIESVLLNKENE